MARYRVFPMSPQQLQMQKRTTILILALSLSLWPACFIGGMFEAAFPWLHLALPIVVLVGAVTPVICLILLLNPKSMTQAREAFEYVVNRSGVGRVPIGTEYIDEPHPIVINPTQTSDSVEVQPRLGSDFLPANTITGFEIRSNGALVLRAKPWPRRLVVPPYLNDIGGFRQELTEMGVPEVRLRGLSGFLDNRATFLALLLGLFCSAYIFLGRSILGISLAAVVCLVFMVLPYVLPKRFPRNCLKPQIVLLIMLMLFIIGMRIWTVSHPRPHGPYLKVHSRQ
jgi:hypothetical protein